MPTYEYTCAACGHDFERFESITAKPNKLCPKCGKKKGERRISAGGGFLFKGSGFYITDYKKTAATTGDSKSGDGKPAESKPSTDTAAKGSDSKSSGSDSKSSSDSKPTGGSDSKSSGSGGDSKPSGGGDKKGGGSKGSKPKVA